MSFQGDVAGIGLGELLQGLARGGREGVLTLRGGGQGATVGLSAGQLHLLPEPDEDPELWRKRCERAWVKDPNQRIDNLRMGEIAFASRLETMFQLLDCQGLHFRFEPGPLPTPDSAFAQAGGKEGTPLGRLETGQKLEVKVPVFCQPISVEYLLLEHARLSDEVSSQAGGPLLSMHDVLRALSPDAPAPSMVRLWGELDGMSNVVEVADRLGWPLRQARATLQELVAKEHLRLADARELLVLAQREIAANHFARAASRLSGWCARGEPGPPAVGDAQLLLTEWQRGKLPVVLASMEPRFARVLLRRIELVEPDVQAAIARWQEARKYHRHDTLSELRQIRWQLRSAQEADQPAISDLLKLARKFQEHGQNLRAGVMLRACTARLPETTSVRLEVGTRLIAVGLAQEGSHWVLEACRTLIDGNMPEKALAPLRTLLQGDPTHREARSLLTAARARTVSGKKGRRNSLVGLAVLLLLACMALVKVRLDQGYDRRLAEVTDCLDRPAVALQMLEESFAEDRSARVQALRKTLQERLLQAERAQRDAWVERYRDCQIEVTLGDARVGLEHALDLPLPPELVLQAEPWPEIFELFQALAARIEQTVAELAPLSDHSTDALNGEKRLLALVQDLAASASGRPEKIGVEGLLQRLESARLTLVERDEQRARARAEKHKQELVQEQDRLLGAARAHALAGDVERAVQNYRKLVGMEGSEAVARMLEKEIAAAEAHRSGWLKARRFAEQGEHAAARAALAPVCPNLREHLLPWKVQSQPAGARVRLADGATRVAPFVLETSIGENVELNFELAGHEPRRVVLEQPADLLVRLARQPERWWRSGGRVEAVPVSVEDGHVVADRAGSLARLGAGSQLAWQVSLQSLGGVARTPVFLPRRQGSLLVVTEEGACWIVEAAGGRVEGPWAMDAPPVEGPTVTASGVAARFRDGRLAQWDSRLRPEITEQAVGPPLQGEHQAPRPGPRLDTYGSDAGLAVLRRRAGAAGALESPWGPWTVALEDGLYVVTRRDAPDRDAFCVRRQGEWVFLAWEAPNSKIPTGRLWISDEAGLRGFLP